MLTESMYIVEIYAEKQDAPAVLVFGGQGYADFWANDALNDVYAAAVAAMRERGAEFSHILIKHGETSVTVRRAPAAMGLYVVTYVTTWGRGRSVKHAPAVPMRTLWQEIMFAFELYHAG